jgi:hypothetical protein
MPAPAAFFMAAHGVLFVTRVALIGLIEVTSFPAVTPYHLAAAYPLWLAFCGVAIATCAQARAPR